MPRGIAITGRLGNDPERFNTKAGKEMVGFRMAENHSYKDRETGEWKNGETEWYDVTCGSDQLGDQAIEHLRKGQKVTVEGNLRSKPSFNQETGEPEVRQMVWANDLRPSLAANAAAEARSQETAGPDAEVNREVAQPAAETPGVQQNQGQPHPMFETQQAQQQYEQAQASWAALEAQQADQSAEWDR